MSSKEVLHIGQLLNRQNSSRRQRVGKAFEHINQLVVSFAVQRKRHHSNATIVEEILRHSFHHIDLMREVALKEVVPGCQRARGSASGTSIGLCLLNYVLEDL